MSKFELKGDQITDPIQLNQEITRSWIAKGILIFIGIIILIILGFFIFSNVAGLEKHNLLITGIFTPCIGLAGVVLGFYFGKK